MHGLLGLTRLSAWWLALGIDLERGRPGCPKDNGGHERLHLDIARELERARLGEEQAVLDAWRETFNRERPHEALGMRCPAELYTRAPRAFSRPVQDLDYPGLRHLRVTNAGCIILREQWIFISGALAGWSVGLEPMTETLWNVWFGRLCLGQIDTQTMSFKSTESAAIQTAATAQQAA